MSQDYHVDVYDKGLEQISNSANWGGGVLKMVMCMAKPADDTEASTLYPSGKRVSGVINMAGGDFTLQNKAGGGREIVTAVKVDAAGVTVVSTENGTAESGSAAALVDTNKAWTVDAWKGWVVEITAGTGAGQKRVISTNSATQLTPETNFTTAPDATSVYKITPDLCIVLYDAGGSPRVLAVVNEDQNGDVAENSVLNIPSLTLGISAPASAA